MTLFELIQALDAAEEEYMETAQQADAARRKLRNLEGELYTRLQHYGRAMHDVQATVPV